MARPSATEYVKKVCGCANWKDCRHPWYVFYRAQVKGKGGAVLRRKLALLVGQEPKDFAEAKKEARRAIVAWMDGKDARDLLPGDAPTLTALLDAYGQRPYSAPIDRYQK